MKKRSPPKKSAPKKVAPKTKKQTSDAISTLASNVLAGRVKPTPAQVKKLAASALGQDETKGKRKKP